MQSLVGTGISVSNITYAGAPNAAGEFSGGTTIGGTDGFGFDSGIVLSTGTAGDSASGGTDTGIIGPNNTSSYSVANGTAGDPDLNALIAPNTTNDAAVLQFDFVPTKSEINFTYLFGSEEYNEYVGDYNDVFAFFVNGTSFADDCATVPGANGQREPVSVDSINDGNAQPGQPPPGPGSNANLFVNNDFQNGTAPYNTQLDGFTVPLVCDAHVKANAVNHIKLAIADAIDDQYDSDVLIEAGSFVAGPPPTQAPVVTGENAQNLSGLTVSAPLATFTNPSGAPASDFAATIDWGDGKPPTDITSLTGNATGNTIGGTHTYTHDGAYHATITLTDTALAGQTFVAHSTVTAYAPFTLTPTSITTAFSQVAPASLQYTTATFTDSDVANTASDYIASINWGDGSPATAASIIGGTGGAPFSVRAIHAYAPSAAAQHPTGFSITTTVTFVSADESWVFTHQEQTAMTAPLLQCTDTFEPQLGISWLSGVDWSTGAPPGTSDAACLGGDHSSFVQILGALESKVQSLALFSTGVGGPTLTVCPSVSDTTSSGNTGMQLTSTLTVGEGSSLVVGDTAACALSVAGTVTNAGTITLCSSTITAQSVVNSGTLDASDASACAPPEIIGFALPQIFATHRQLSPATASTNVGTSGDTLNGPLDNSGIISVAPGDTLAALSYTQHPGGTLSVGLGSSDGSLAMSGPAALAGTLTVVPGASTPAAGSFAPLMTYASESGAYSTVSGVSAGQAAYGQHTMSLVVGTLPAVLSIDPTTAAPYGTPTSFTAQVLPPSALPSYLPAPAGSVQFLDGSNVKSERRLSAPAGRASRTH